MGTSSTPGLYDYSTTAASNETAGDVNFAEGQAPNTVNDSLRQVLADIRTWYENAEWIDYGHTPVYVSATSFTIATDVTGIYPVGQRLKLYGSTMGTFYADIITSVYSAPNTTITLSVDDAESLTSNLSRVWYGILGSLSRRRTPQPNALINGDFRVNQWMCLGATATSTSQYLMDRWYSATNVATRVHSRQTFTAGQTDVPGEPVYYARTVVTAGGANAASYSYLAQTIESVRTFAGQVVTLSFYAKADASKNMALEFYQSFGSGGSPSAGSSSSAHTVSLTSSWQKFTITTTIDSITGKTLGTTHDGYLGLFLWFDAGSTYNSRTNTLGQQSGTFDIANVKLEPGSVATDFVPRSYAEELAMCQRYCYVLARTTDFTNALFIPGGSGVYYSATEFRCAFPLPVEMRANPTTTTSGSGYISVQGPGSVSVGGSVGFSNNSKTACQMEISASPGSAIGYAGIAYLNATGAYIINSAEL